MLEIIELMEEIKYLNAFDTPANMRTRNLLHELMEYCRTTVRARVCLAIVLIMISGSAWCTGQSIPFPHNQALVCAFNKAIERAQIDSYYGSLDWWTYLQEPECLAIAPGPFQYVNEQGECVTLSSSDIRLERQTNGTIQVRTLLRAGADPVPVLRNSHYLVGDLNNWLKNAFGKEIQDLPTISNAHDTLFDLPCNSSPSNYFIDTVQRAWWARAVYDSLGISRIRSTRYNIYGSYKYGGEFIFPYVLQADSTTIRYFADRDQSSNGTRGPNAKAKLAHSHLRIQKIQGNQPYYFDIDISVSPQSYPNQPCGLAGSAVPTWTIAISQETDQSPPPITTTCFDEIHQADGCCGLDPVQIADSNNALLWSYFTSPLAGMAFESDTLGNLNFKITEQRVGCNTTTFSNILKLTNTAATDDSCTETFCEYQGQFEVDTITGAIVFRNYASSPCGPEGGAGSLCINLCGDSIPHYATRMTRVIAASAQQYSDAWPYSVSEYGAAVPESNVYETGEKGRWRVASNHVYRTDIYGGAAITNAYERNYDSAGVFKDFLLFNYGAPGDNDTTRWLKSNTVTSYSPGGEPVEERDILGVANTAKFGHAHQVPILVANNATYDDVVFDSFEDRPGDPKYVYGVAHSGRRSLRITNGNNSGDTVVRIDFSDYLRTSADRGVSIKFWAKRTYHSSTPVEPVGVNIRHAYVPYSDSSFTRIAQTGEWSLYEKRLLDIDTAQISLIPSITVDIRDLSTTDTIWIDDIRIQPIDAHMMCYVYDANTLRLLTTFDDDHFGSYYQYNAEGKLVRKLRETERGMKTIAEAQYNVPRVARTQTFAAAMSTPGGGSARAMRQGGGGSYDGAEGESTAVERSDGTTFDILDIEAGVGKPKVTVFGSENPQLPDLGFSGLTLPQLGMLGIPDLDVAKQIYEIRDLDKEIRELATQKTAELSDDASAELDENIQELQERRADLIRKIDMPKEKIEQVLQDVEDLERLQEEGE